MRKNKQEGYIDKDSRSWLIFKTITKRINAKIFL